MIFIIVSKSFSQIVVPIMEDISQVASVYISGETFALAKQYTKDEGCLYRYSTNL